MIATRNITLKTRPDLDILDITELVQKELDKSGLKEGMVNVFSKGSTASISTMEYEPNLKKDIKEALEGIAPSKKDYAHHKTWGDRNGKSHIKSTLMGPSATIPFTGGRLLLGEWQQLVLLDFDVPGREREVVLTIMGE